MLAVRTRTATSEMYDDGAYTLWLHDTDVTSWASADWEPDRAEYEVYQPGPRYLWDELETAWRRWESLGKPDFKRFGLTVTPDSQTVGWTGRKVP